VSLSTANALLSLRFSRATTAAEVSIPETHPDTVRVLTRRLAAGDEEAFREFHDHYFDRLYHYLLVVAHGQEQEAREALQETLLRVVRYARVFDDETAFWCWLKVVARCAARDGGRKRRRYFALLERFALRWSQNTHVSGNDNDSLRSLLAESLEELPADDRRLIEGKYLEGEAVKDLSALTGLTDRAVESRLRRLRLHLRERLLKKLREL